MIKVTKKQCEIERKNLQQLNPSHKFRVSFCKDAKEYVTQIYEGNKTWFCLHNE